MNLNLTHKTAIITGATAGIGLAIAKTLYQEGANVVITGRNAAKLSQAAAEILPVASAGRLQEVVCNLSTAQGCQTLIEQAPTADILINNLGTYTARDFFTISDQEWQAIFETNVLSGVRLARHYLKLMLDKNWGRVIFIASEAGIMIQPDLIDYGMTKTSQLAIARGLAELTKGTQVTVNSIMPGPSATEGIGDFLKSISSNPQATIAEAEKEFFARHRPSSLLQRFIQPQEIANLAAYIASPLSSATNGAALRAEGGLLRSIY